MKIPFIGGAYEGRSSNVSPETCLNLFYEKGSTGEALVGVPGSTALATPAAGEVRGGIAYNNLAYFVIADTFYEIDPAGNATSRGTINTSTGKVSLAHNGVRAGANQQIMLVDGVDGWIFDNTATTFTQITDTDFVSSDSVVYIDGYFVFAQNGGSDRFYITAQYDGTSIEALDFATAEGSPDAIQSLLTDNRELYIFGEETVEVWYNSGDTDNTFQRYQGGFKQHGCAAKDTPARFDNTVIWLSRNERGDGQVVQMSQGYQPAVVSSPEVNYQISTYNGIEDAFGYSYQHEGHEFYVLTFPSANVTWAYDASTKMWHKRGHYIGSRLSRERYNCHVFAFGEHLFGDLSDGIIYKLDGSIGIINGERILKERTTMAVSDEENRRRVVSMQLDMEEGIGEGIDLAGTTNAPLITHSAPQSNFLVDDTTGMEPGMRVQFDLTDGSQYTTYITVVPNGVNFSIPVAHPIPLDWIAGADCRFWAEKDDDIVDLSYSKDGGHTFSNAQQRNAGVGGEWAKRVIWRKLGQARNWIFRIRSHCPTRPIFKGLIAKMYGER